jgi:hypothetical protein
MLLEQPSVNVHAPITPEEATAVIANNIWGNDPALKLVVQDALRAENFASTKSWVMQWPSATTLYQSPYTAQYWEGTQSERANVPFFTVATAVNSLVPQIINGLFYDDPPFMIQKRPGTSQTTASAIGALLAYQLEDIGFREELKRGCFNAVLFGTGIWKWGWETFTRTRKIYVRPVPEAVVPNVADTLPDIAIEAVSDDDAIEEQIVEEVIDRPVFENITNLRYVLVDPGLNVPSISKGKYVIHRMYLTWSDLDKLRERPGFTIPEKEALLQLFLPPKEPVEAAPSEVTNRNPLWDARAEARYEATTEDPFEQPLEVLERWDNGKCIAILNKKVVICNDQNPYGEIPFLSVGWWDVPEAFWSMGLAKVIGAEQRLQQGLTNLYLDNAALNLNGVYIRVRGKSVPTQSIRISPGKIVDVDNKDDFKPLERLNPVPEAERMLAFSESRSERVSGVSDPGMQGVAGQSGHSSLARTASGANLLAAGAGSRVADFVEKLSDNVIVPFLYRTHELNRSMLPVSAIKYILGEELQHAFMTNKGDVLEILNARVKFAILAAAKLQARRAMAQSLPMIVQFLTSPETTKQLAAQGKKVKIDEVVKMFFAVSDWKTYDDVIVDMTDEEKKQSQANSPAAIAAAKAQAAQAAQAQQHDNKADLAEQENIARAGRDVLKHGLDQESIGAEEAAPAAGLEAAPAAGLGV